MKAYKRIFSRNRSYLDEKILDDVIIAESFSRRLTGLVFMPKIGQSQGLYIPCCTSIHTMWMRYSIDVLFLDKKDRIIKTVESLPPFRFSTIVRSSAAVLEIASGSIKRLGIEIDDILILR